MTLTLAGRTATAAGVMWITFAGFAAEAATIFPTLIATFPTPVPSVPPVNRPSFNCLQSSPRRAYIKASNTGPSDEFGGEWRGSVALSADGNTLAVGAPDEDSNGNQADNSSTDSGAVYVFVRSGQTWVQQGYLKASNLDSGDSFGYSVALSADGNRLVVGATDEDSAATGVDGDSGDNSQRDIGAAYVFSRSNQVWSQQAYLKPWDIYPSSAGFGESVAISKDGARIAVGAPCAENCAGSVFVFKHTTTGWDTDAHIAAPSSFSGTQFGWSVALDENGGTLAVGAPFEDSEATGIDSFENSTRSPNSGAVYVYVHVRLISFSFWIRDAYIKAAETDDNDSFGYSVALSNDGATLLVGAPYEDGGSSGMGGDPTDNSATSSGAAYVFGASGGWSQDHYLKAPTGTGGDFGKVVAISDDGGTLAVSAPGEDSSCFCVNDGPPNTGAPNSGAVHFFRTINGSLTPSDYVKAANTETVDIFGYGMAISGNGLTLAAAAPLEDSNATGVNGHALNNNATGSGAAFVYSW